MQNGLRIRTMKKILIASLLASGLLYGQEGDFRLSASLVGMSMDYTEYDGGGTAIDSEESALNEIYGLDVGLSYLLSKNPSTYSEINSNLMIVGGDTVYKGSILGSGDPIGTVVSATVNTIIDFDVNYAKNYKVYENIELKYGLGVGYRYWERALSASQIEIYTWYSLRPMIGVSYTINNALRVGLDVDYQYGVNPNMNESTHGDFTLGGADIVEVSLPISYKYDENMEIFFQYAYQEQTIKKSNVVNEYYEPDSTARNQYVKFGLAFKY